MDEYEIVDLIGYRLPHDGLHDGDTVLAAAAGLRELGRYLNNATGPGGGAVTLRYAPTVDRVLWNLVTVAGGLDQLLRQLAAALERQAEQADLYDDRRDRPGADTAKRAVAGIEHCRTTVGVLVAELEQVCALTSHLGHDLDD